MRYHGTRTVHFKPRGGGLECGMKFHVTDSTKPLASAAAIASMGNRVVLQGGDGPSYIEHVATGKRIDLRISGGTYVFDAESAAGFTRRG